MWVLVFDVVSVNVRERAVELLGELYKGHLPLYDVDDSEQRLRVHIIKRLRRLCTVPDDTRLTDVAKQTLKEAYLFKKDAKGWKRLLCGDKAAAGASIAGTTRPTHVCMIIVARQTGPSPRLVMCRASVRDAAQQDGCVQLSNHRHHPATAAVLRVVRRRHGAVVRQLRAQRRHICRH